MSMKDRIIVQILVVPQVQQHHIISSNYSIILKYTQNSKKSVEKCIKRMF